MRLPMYDVRGTMYDLNASAPEARAMRSRGGETPPMYDVRFDSFTIWEGCARGADFFRIINA